MLNPYIVIIAFFTLAALGTMLWGWRIIVKARKTNSWPCVEGIIIESSSSQDNDGLLPHILYSYHIDDKHFRKKMVFPAGTSPTPEFSQSYVNRFPKGKQVQVCYNPDNPDETTLEPGLRNGEWMIFALGLLGSLFGLYALTTDF